MCLYADMNWFFFIIIILYTIVFFTYISHVVVWFSVKANIDFYLITFLSLLFFSHSEYFQSVLVLLFMFQLICPTIVIICFHTIASRFGIKFYQLLFSSSSFVFFFFGKNSFYLIKFNTFGIKNNTVSTHCTWSGTENPANWMRYMVRWTNWWYQSWTDQTNHHQSIWRR